MGNVGSMGQLVSVRFMDAAGPGAWTLVFLMEPFSKAHPTPCILSRSVPMGCEMGRAYEHATPLGWAIWELNVGAVEIFLEALKLSSTLSPKTP